MDANTATDEEKFIHAHECRVRALNGRLTELRIEIRSDIDPLRIGWLAGNAFKLAEQISSDEAAYKSAQKREMDVVAASIVLNSFFSFIATILDQAQRFQKVEEEEEARAARQEAQEAALWLGKLGDILSIVDVIVAQETHWRWVQENPMSVLRYVLQAADGVSHQAILAKTFADKPEATGAKARMDSAMRLMRDSGFVRTTCDAIQKKRRDRDRWEPAHRTNEQRLEAKIRLEAHRAFGKPVTLTIWAEPEFRVSPFERPSLVLRRDWLRTVHRQGLASINDRFTLCATPVQPPKLDQETDARFRRKIRVYEARWLEGKKVRVGFIAVGEKTATHANSLTRALSDLKRKEDRAQ